MRAARSAFRMANVDAEGVANEKSAISHVFEETHRILALRLLKMRSQRKGGPPGGALIIPFPRQRRHTIGGIQICDLVGGVSFRGGDGGTPFSLPSSRNLTGGTVRL